MRTPCLFPTTALFLFFLSTFLLPAASSPIPASHENELKVAVDSSGNPISVDKEYYIKWAVIGFSGGLVLKPNTYGACARYAGFSSDETEPGTPVRFLPYENESGLILAGAGWRFKLEFMAFDPCVGSGEWTVDENSYLVGGGGKNAIYFELRETSTAGKYEVVPCGTCAPCDVFYDGRLLVDDQQLLRANTGSSTVAAVRFHEVVLPPLEATAK